MSDTVVFTPGGYRYLPAVFQYSSGVAAEAGLCDRARTLHEALPLAAGFAKVEGYLAGSAVR